MCWCIIIVFMRSFSSVKLFKKSYILIEEICLFITPKQLSRLFNTEEIYKIFFYGGEGIVDFNFPIILLHFLDSIVRDEIKSFQLMLIMKIICFMMNLFVI